jgi:hypothetical protein
MVSSTSVAAAAAAATTAVGLSIVASPSTNYARTTDEYPAESPSRISDDLLIDDDLVSLLKGIDSPEIQEPPKSSTTTTAAHETASSSSSTSNNLRDREDPWWKANYIHSFSKTVAATKQAMEDDAPVNKPSAKTVGPKSKKPKLVEGIVSAAFSPKSGKVKIAVKGSGVDDDEDEDFAAWDNDDDFRFDGDEDGDF